MARDLSGRPVMIPLKFKGNILLQIVPQLNRFANFEQSQASPILVIMMIGQAGVSEWRAIGRWPTSDDTTKPNSTCDDTTKPKPPHSTPMVSSSTQFKSSAHSTVQKCSNVFFVAVKQCSAI